MVSILINLLLLLPLLLHVSLVLGDTQPEEIDETEALLARIRRDVSETDIRDALCKDKNPGEFFRLVAGAAHCRDVVACSEGGLQAIRCPPGLAFDLDKQTCEWKNAIKNCNIKARPKLALPLFNTPEPLCDKGFLACGDSVCLKKELFCDEKPDCADLSDENLCGPRTDPNRADTCDSSICKLPDCFCSPTSTKIPGGLAPQDTPQMIMLSFDDAVNNNNFDIYQRLFNGQRKNPNSCDIKATFFVSHRYTNYSMVEELYRQGHEMASHSITHTNDEDYWTHGSKEQWIKEMGGVRDIIEEFGGVPAGGVYGARSPLLRLGGNRQFAALEEAQFLYDSSMVAPLQNPPLWPYTTFFSLPHQCHGNFQKCPTRSHEIWEMVLNEFDPREQPGKDETEQVSGCAMLDSCSSLRTPDNLYNVLTHNFIRHYEQNRAPLGLYMHAAWFSKSPEMMDALEFWIDEILSTYNNVYFVTMQDVLKFMQTPFPHRDAIKFPGWKERCTLLDVPDRCTVSNNCELSTSALGGNKQRMQTCSRCPDSYPWLGDPKGSGRPEELAPAAAEQKKPLAATLKASATSSFPSPKQESVVGPRRRQ